jgi:hypothetical protein
MREDGEEQLRDEVIGALRPVRIGALRPGRRQGAWFHARWAAGPGGKVKAFDAGPQLAHIQGNLIRRGVVVPHRTLHRFAMEECGFARRQPTLRVADG